MFPYWAEEDLIDEYVRIVITISTVEVLTVRMVKLRRKKTTIMILITNTCSEASCGQPGLVICLECQTVVFGIERTMTGGMTRNI